MTRPALVALSVALLTLPALALPPGFVEEELFPAFYGPESIDFEPDGTLWIAQSGPGEGMKLFVAEPGSTTPVLAHDFGTFPTGERGIHAIKVDPDFDTNGWLWVYYTVIGETVFNRLSRFDVSGATLSNETPVYDGPLVNTEIHNGGCLDFASDGTIFLGVGDDISGVAAQDTFVLKGKILHMTRDGQPAADNPFLDGSAGHPLVWGYGVRNPYRCAVQPGLDNLFVADVGNATWEEVSIGTPGAHFGWPACEGPDNTDIANPGPCTGNYLLPIHSYNHNGQTAAIIGGVHVEPGDLAPAYEGDYFFGDWFSGAIWRLQLDASNNVTAVKHFTDIEAGGRLIDFAMGPDGALYYAGRGAVSNIVRVSWVGGDNGQPQADARVLPDVAGAAPLSVTLDGSGSSDPDDDPLSFDWDLGDQSSSTVATVAKTYQQGVYDVSLTVDDGQLVDSSPTIRIVSGNTRPSASISAPVDGSSYDAGDTIGFGGAIGDAEDTAIGVMCQQYTWQVIFHHLDHTHPFLGPVSGLCSGSFEIPVQGETSPVTWYEVRLVGQDLGSPLGPEGVLTGASSVEIFPNLSTITLETDPPGLQVALDGLPQTTPASIQSVVNMTRSLDALDGQAPGGHTYQFVSWSDGGAAQHDISVPSADTTYTASYACSAIGEVSGLRVEPDDGELVLSWDPAPELCIASGGKPYTVYAAPTFLPAVGGGSFPTDPSFRIVGSTDSLFLRFEPLPTDQVFLVTVKGAGNVEGPAGHYEP